MESIQEDPKLCLGNKDSWDFLQTKYDLEIVGFTYSDWVGDNIDRKYTSGYVFMLGDRTIIWSSKKHRAIALSSTKAEYRGVVNATTQCLWL